MSKLPENDEKSAKTSEENLDQLAEGKSQESSDKSQEKSDVIPAKAGIQDQGKILNQVQDDNEAPQNKKPETSLVPYSRNPKKMGIMRRLWEYELSFQSFFVSHLLLLVAALALLGGLYYVLNKDNPSFDFKKYLPVTRMPVSFNLDILNPEDNLVVFDKNLIITGKATSRASVLISVDSSKASNNQAFETNGNGEFSKIAPLFTGLNIITVTAFDPKGNVKTAQRTIYFTEEKLDNDNQNTTNLPKMDISQIEKVGKEEKK